MSRCFARKLINIGNRILRRSLRGKLGFFLALEDYRAEETSSASKGTVTEYASVREEKRILLFIIPQSNSLVRFMWSDFIASDSLFSFRNFSREIRERRKIRGSGAYEIKPLPRRQDDRVAAREIWFDSSKLSCIYDRERNRKGTWKGSSAKERISDSKRYQETSGDSIKMIFLGMQSRFWKKTFLFFSKE